MAIICPGWVLFLASFSVLPYSWICDLVAKLWDRARTGETGQRLMFLATINGG